MDNWKIYVAVVVLGALIITVLLCIPAMAATSYTQESAIQAVPPEENYTRYRDIIMNMTEQEIVEIQQVLYWEAKDDTWEGRVATAQVMINRVLSNEFPNTVHGVLSQKKPCTQYSTYYKRSRAKYDERECDAIEFLCNCSEDELCIDYNRLYQDCKPIGKSPIKIGKQYFGY